MALCGSNMSDMLRQVIMMMGKVTSSTITFVNSTTSFNNAISKPTGTVAGDLIVIAGSEPAPSTWTAPAGFTNITGTSTYANMCYKFATGSEGSTFFYSGGGGGGGTHLVCAVFRGATAVDVIGAGTAATGTTIDAPSVTTTVPNAMLIAGFSANTGVSISTAPGMTKIQSISGVSCTIQYQIVPSAGATGVRTIVAGSSSELTAGMFAIR